MESFQKVNGFEPIFFFLECPNPFLERGEKGDRDRHQNPSGLFTAWPGWAGIEELLQPLNLPIQIIF
jgi:hypothetical protein